MIIGIDFDGTCVKHAFPKIGEEIGAAPVLKELVEIASLRKQIEKLEKMEFKENK